MFSRQVLHSSFFICFSVAVLAYASASVSVSVSVTVCVPVSVCVCVFVSISVSASCSPRSEDFSFHGQDPAIHIDNDHLHLCLYFVACPFQAMHATAD